MLSLWICTGMTTATALDALCVLGLADKFAILMQSLKVVKRQLVSNALEGIPSRVCIVLLLCSSSTVFVRNFNH